MMDRSDVSYDGVYSFYLGRIEACQNYGWNQGDQINSMIFNCAVYDTLLTDAEYAVILNKCWDNHTRFMEEMRNDGWK